VLELELDKVETARQHTELLINVEESVFKVTNHRLEDRTFAEFVANVRRNDDSKSGD